VFVNYDGCVGVDAHWVCGSGGPEVGLWKEGRGSKFPSSETHETDYSFVEDLGALLIACFYQLNYF